MKIELNRFAPRVSLASTALVLTMLLGFQSGRIGPSVAAAHQDTMDDLKALFVPKLPENAQEISKVMGAAKIGETVNVHGYIPMTGGFGADNDSVTLIEPVAAEPGKPNQAVPAARQATIKFVDSQGAPLKGTLEGKFGLKAGAEVFVTGKVLTANGKDSLVITVQSVHVPRSPLPSTFFSDTSPASSIDVSAAKKAGGQKVGDEVVLRGRIGGSKEPFVNGRAVFTLMGRGLKACSENPGDNCKMPWDYCCETKDEITAHSATIQVVDDKGQVLRTDMKGRRGMKELTEIVVTGKVAVSDGKLMVVNATSIVVVK